jgi:hypothetical protein
MTDATSTTFVGSHEKPDNSYGQNGSPQSASLKPGQTKPNIAKVSPPNLALPNANSNHADDQARLDAISGKPIKAHSGMSPRVSDEKVPSANVRKSRTDGVARPTR